MPSGSLPTATRGIRPRGNEILVPTVIGDTRLQSGELLHIGCLTHFVTETQHAVMTGGKVFEAASKNLELLVELLHSGVKLLEPAGELAYALVNDLFIISDQPPTSTMTPKKAALHTALISLSSLQMAFTFSSRSSKRT